MILDQVCVAKTLLNSWSCWGTVEMARTKFSQAKLGRRWKLECELELCSKCTIVLKVFATRTAWDFHNVIPTDHRSFLKCKVLFGMSIKGIVKIERKKNWPNFFCQYCQPAKNQPKSHFILFLKMAPCATFM